ncbi:hypothetical protein [Natronomonas sp. LN261]|uniref:helix-turn-helix transcriptional regulator n=1 Tax=Natronomonas sp. LN261 TaxID=2750669 RepID=UPI0015EF7372|nr:hypothetical protein [Natronomonas sp. LN261]
MRCWVPTLLCALLLICAPALGAAPVAGQPQADGTHLEAQLQADGDAAWNVTLRIPLEDERDREEFEAFARRFEAGEDGFDLGADAFRRAAEEASDASGRRMSIDSVRRDSEIRNGTVDGETTQYGVLRVAFTWESFARVDEDDTLYVDDAFNTTDGTWLPGLGADQSLTILAPPGYGGPTTSPIGANGGDLRWDGPATFDPGYMSIVYHPSSTGPTTDGISNTLVTGALVLSGAALVVGLYLLFTRRGDGRRGESTDALETPDRNGGAEGPADGSAAPVSAEADGAAADDETPPDGSEGGEKPDPELLSDEERVEYLLERNGGRMKQANIVKETGWSNAKVSQLLSSMDDDDRVDKLRIGRENLISLPGEGIGELDGDKN